MMRKRGDVILAVGGLRRGKTVDSGDERLYHRHLKDRSSSFVDALLACPLHQRNFNLPKTRFQVKKKLLRATPSSSPLLQLPSGLSTKFRA